MQVDLFTDGGARGNPGPGAGGIFVKTDGFEYRWGFFLGTVTNNQAEYMALILALETIIKTFDAERLDLINAYLDSELIVKQLAGEYKVKDPTLKTLYSRVQRLKSKFAMIKFKHVKREKNKEADLIVNQVLDIQEKTGT